MGFRGETRNEERAMLINCKINDKMNFINGSF